MLTTTQRVIVQLTDGTRLLETPLIPEASEYDRIRVLRPLRATAMPTFLWYSLRGRAQQEQVTEFSADGAIAHRYTLAPPTLWRIRRFQPLVGAGAITLGVQASVGRAAASTGESRFEPIFALGLPLLASVLAGAAAFHRAGVYAFDARRRRFWTVLSILLGFLGYLTMLALIEWPALERCPACGKKRIVTLEHCEHCREPFASPSMDGTEIFEN